MAKYVCMYVCNPCQHSFRKSRSSTTNILKLIIVNEGFSKKMQTAVIHTDISKAFDKGNHKLLLYKLNYQWLNSHTFQFI